MPEPEKPIARTLGQIYDAVTQLKKPGQEAVVEASVFSNSYGQPASIGDLRTQVHWVNNYVSYSGRVELQRLDAGTLDMFRIRSLDGVFEQQVSLFDNGEWELISETRDHSKNVQIPAHIGVRTTSWGQRDHPNYLMLVPLAKSK